MSKLLKYLLAFFLVYSVTAIITGMIEQSWYYKIANSESDLEPYTKEYVAAMPTITKVSYYLHFKVLRFPVGTYLNNTENKFLEQIAIFSFIFNSILACFLYVFVKNTLLSMRKRQ